MDKDILSLIVLKISFADVLNLRATCKYIDRCIRSYNKFWFLKWLDRAYRFKGNPDEAEELKSINLGKKTCPIYSSLNIPYINCVYKDYYSSKYSAWPAIKLIDTVMLHPQYPIWVKEFQKVAPKEILKIKDYEEGYCNAKYCRLLFPDYECENHYKITIDKKYLLQNFPEIIDEKLVQIYNSQKNYFISYLNFKPKHDRCNLCKKIFNPKKEECNCIIRVHGLEDYYEGNTSWKNSQIPSYLTEGAKICDDCIDILMDKGELLFEEFEYEK
jgi:hypothetical protein